MLPEVSAVLRLLEGGFSQLRVLVVGDLMLDRFILGEVERISPEAPVPILRHAERYEHPGGAANVAMNLAGLGCQTFLAGLWGVDNDQAVLARLLQTAGIDTLGVVSSSLPTTSKTRFLGRSQQILRLDLESRELPPDAESNRLQERATALAAKMHAVVLSDYARGALTDPICEAVIRAARLAGIPVVVDPKTRYFNKYSGATTVCPNLAELSAATGVPAWDTPRLLAAARELLAEHDFAYLTVTSGERGIRIIAPEGEYQSPARAREVYDVSGAGDTVVATLASSLAGGLKRETAVELANLAAGIVVGKAGTAPIDAHELVAALTRTASYTSAEKILDFSRARLRVAEWRAAGETIVFTDGCFDLIHAGHIALFEGCRRFGSKLVLGLQADASVSRLKGPTRPIVGERERARVVAAMGNVDAVVLFDQDSPLELIRLLEPHVLVKGGDYTVESVVGHQDVAAGGGRVEIVPHVEGFSTTHLVRILSSAY